MAESYLARDGLSSCYTLADQYAAGFGATDDSNSKRNAESVQANVQPPSCRLIPIISAALARAAGEPSGSCGCWPD